MDINALVEEIARLKAENQELKTVPVVMGTDMWGRPRAPLTDEERRTFAQANRKNMSCGNREPSTTLEDRKLSVATKLVALHEANTKMRKEAL